MVSEKTKLSIGNISTHLNHASYSLGNQTNLTIAICKERSESFDCKNTRSKGKVQTNVSRDFSPLDRANSTNDRQLKSIIELLTHLNHSITDSNNNHWFKMSTARKETFTSAVGILNQISPFKKQSIPRNLTFCLTCTIPAYFQRTRLKAPGCSGERSDFGVASRDRSQAGLFGVKTDRLAQVGKRSYQVCPTHTGLFSLFHGRMPPGASSMFLSHRSNYRTCWANLSNAPRLVPGDVSILFPRETRPSPPPFEHPHCKRCLLWACHPILAVCTWARGCGALWRSQTLPLSNRANTLS